jgi:hypothetical protein
LAGVVSIVRRPIKLAQELQQGPREVDLYEWTGVKFALPAVEADGRVSAEEVMRKALHARGGTEALASIHSYHAKGTVEQDLGLAASLVEFFMTESNQFFAGIECKSHISPQAGYYEEGFDGRTAWEAQSKTSSKVLNDRRYRNCRDFAAFFAWCDLPEHYQSAECAGEAWFEGRKCYVLKLVTWSGRELTHYYDSSTFLLAGGIEVADTALGPVLSKATYSAYQPFGGFLFPTLLRTDSKLNRTVIRHDSLELNGVEASVFETPLKAKALAAHSAKGPSAAQPPFPFPIDPKVYDGYVGQYRHFLLFGLVHVGPTLSIWRKTDAVGDHLIVSARGLGTGELYPVSETSFVDNLEPENVVFRVTFLKDRKRGATGLMAYWHGNKLGVARISREPAGWSAPH